MSQASREPAAPGGVERLILVKKLVALDITLHGNRFILAEFGIGTPVIFGVGFWLTASNASFILGLYLLLTGVNYVPLLAYAVMIARAGTAKTEVRYGLERDRHYVRKYSTQQLLILVPLAILVLAIVLGVARRQIP